jgi:hypothetical protein
MQKEKVLHCPECGVVMVYHDMSDNSDYSLHSLEEDMQDSELEADVSGN